MDVWTAGIALGPNVVLLGKALGPNVVLLGTLKATPKTAGIALARRSLTPWYSKGYA